jgi:hypothetical protein
MKEDKESLCGKTKSKDIEGFLTGLNEDEVRKLCAKVGHAVCPDCIKYMYVDSYNIADRENQYIPDDQIFDLKFTDRYSIKRNRDSGIFHIFGTYNKSICESTKNADFVTEFENLDAKETIVQCAEIGRDVCAHCVSKLYLNMSLEKQFHRI